MAALHYLEEVCKLLQVVAKSQIDAIRKASELVAQAIAQGGLLHVFGVGHSHILAEEVFFRAGGLAPVNAILEPGLMLHAGALKSTWLEKVHGYAHVLLDYHKVKPKDVLLIASNSGVNAVPLEMALEARQRDIRTIAITSVEYSRKIKGDQKALFEVVDVVIDNCGVYGDAILELPGLKERVGPSSTVIGAAIVNAIVVEAIAALLSQGIIPPVYVSSHQPGASEHNLRLAETFWPRLRAL
ncbi:MAG: SIS domain-containing protein [Thermofilaceae archaeon]